MSKKKAVMCTILFAIVIWTIWIVTHLIKNEYGSLYDIIAPWVVGLWMCDKTSQFYNWLMK